MYYFSKNQNFFDFMIAIFKKLMGNSLGGEHSSHMFNAYYFPKSNIVGMEIIPPVQRGSSFPVQCVILWTEN